MLCSGVERALALAEPDRLILPFAMPGAWRLLESLPSWDTGHRAQISDILDAVHGSASPADAGQVRAEPLSPSELRVLRHLPTNLTRQEIANGVTVSLNTVNTHLRSIYAKLGVGDPWAAVSCVFCLAAGPEIPVGDAAATRRPCRSPSGG
ncbi:LuxR C-terminal-related transcriptional regulator [Streptomyces sp. NPDC020794]|uniref:helix-turn-helix transcriptional regulator n=1 Tax=unclassified Streptomyces TaxID=2593676 RepID=UPI0036EB1F31